MLNQPTFPELLQIRPGCQSRLSGIKAVAISQMTVNQIVKQKVRRLKVATFIYRHLQGNPGQQRFTIRSGELTVNNAY